jgi:PST family polysaccharide transporter
LAGTFTNVIVAAELGARGVGLFAWCTILATPVSGALSAVHSVSLPTLARMRRDDGTRYDESVGVVMRTLACTAAITAGCLIGMASPTIRYVFGERWLPATAAVQFCLAGTIPTAILSVLASDANARQMRGPMLVSALAGGAATLVTLWPLAALYGVGGASAAANCVGPIAGVAVFYWVLRPPLTATILRPLRLFAPLLAFSFLVSRLVHTPVEFVAACIATAAAGAAAGFIAEGELLRRIVRVMRARAASAAPTVSDGAVTS